MADDDGDVGTISASLVGRAASGATYRLRDAVITVSGPRSFLAWNTEDDPGRPSLSASVPAGDYSASLQPGWRLERIDGDSPTAVDAALVSANPVEFDVVPGERTSVPLQFQVGAELVDTATGYDITVGVEELPVREIFIGDVGGSIRVFAATAAGDVAPLRTIEGPATGLVNPTGLSIAGDELVVADIGAHAVFFFPLSASGDVAPTRRLSWPDTFAPIKTVVFGSEIYVSSHSGPLRVFPFPSTEADPVTRSLSILSRTGMTPMAIDGGELYVGTGTGGHIYPMVPAGSPAFPPIARTFAASASWRDIAIRGDLVFAAMQERIEVYPKTGGTGLPLRAIGGPNAALSPFGIAVAGDTIFLANQRDVQIFRADADGDVLPLRWIAGPATGLTQAWGIAVR